jgi:hypothetical protein
MVDLHRGFIDMRLQRVWRVGEWWKCKCHSVSEPILRPQAFWAVQGSGLDV